MPDRDKVIKGLECCILRNPDDHARCSQCPYGSNCVNRLKMNALELLKKRETNTGKWLPIESPTGVKAFGIQEMTVMGVCCSACGSKEDVSFTGYKYCPNCGAKMEEEVKQDG